MLRVYGPSLDANRVMGLLASPLDLWSSGDTRHVTLWRIQLGRADMRDDTALTEV